MIKRWVSEIRDFVGSIWKEIIGLLVGIGLLTWTFVKMWSEGGLEAVRWVEMQIVPAIPVVENGIQATAMFCLALFLTWTVLYSLSVWHARRGYFLFGSTVLVLAGLATEGIFIPQMEPTAVNGTAFLSGFIIAILSEVSWTIPSVSVLPEYDYTGGVSESSWEHSTLIPPRAFKKVDAAQDERGRRPVKFQTASTGIGALLLLTVLATNALVLGLVVQNELIAGSIVISAVGSVAFVVSIYSLASKQSNESTATMFGDSQTGKTLAAYGILDVIKTHDRYEYWDNNNWSGRVEQAEQGWYDPHEGKTWGFESTGIAIPYSIKFANTDEWHVNMFNFWDYPGNWHPGSDSDTGQEAEADGGQGGQAGASTEDVDEVSPDSGTTTEEKTGSSQSESSGSPAGDVDDRSSRTEFVKWDSNFANITAIDKSICEYGEITPSDVANPGAETDLLIDNISRAASEMDKTIRDEEKLRRNINRLKWVYPLYDSAGIDPEKFRYEEIDFLSDRYESPTELVRETELDGSQKEEIRKAVDETTAEDHESRVDELNSIFETYREERDETGSQENKTEDTEGETIDTASEDDDEKTTDASSENEWVNPIDDADTFEDEIINEDLKHADTVLWTVDAEKLIQDGWIPIESDEIKSTLNQSENMLRDHEEKIIKYILENNNNIGESAEDQDLQSDKKVLQEKTECAIFMIVTKSDILYPFYRAEVDEDPPELANVEEDFDNFVQWVRGRLNTQKRVTLFNRLSKIYPVLYKTEVQAPENENEDNELDELELRPSSQPPEPEGFGQLVEGVFNE